MKIKNFLEFIYNNYNILIKPEVLNFDKYIISTNENLHLKECKSVITYSLNIYDAPILLSILRTLFKDKDCYFVENNILYLFSSIYYTSLHRHKNFGISNYRECITREKSYIEKLDPECKTTFSYVYNYKTKLEELHTENHLTEIYLLDYNTRKLNKRELIETKILQG